MSKYHNGRFSESLAVVKLDEHHDKQVISTGKVYDIHALLYCLTTPSKASFGKSLISCMKIYDPVFIWP